MLTTAQRQQAAEYESRLFDGGAYSPDQLRFAAPDAPLRQIIRQARERYNTLRKLAGLPPANNWRRPPAVRIG